MAQRDGRHASQGFTHASPQATRVSPQETSATSQDAYARFWEDRPGGGRRSRSRRPQQRQRARSQRSGSDGVAEEWLFGKRSSEETLLDEASPRGPSAPSLGAPLKRPATEPPRRERRAPMRPLSERRSPAEHPSSRFPAGGRFDSDLDTTEDLTARGLRPRAFASEPGGLASGAVGAAAGPAGPASGPRVMPPRRDLGARPRAFDDRAFNDRAFDDRAFDDSAPARATREERVFSPGPRGKSERRAWRGGRPSDRARRRDDARPAAPRPRIKLGQTDRLSAGALTLSVVVGLSLLAVVERAVIEGGPIGTPQQAGSAGALPDERDKTTRPQREQPSQRPAQTPGASAPAAPDVETLTAQIRRVTLQERGPAARLAYGAEVTGQPIVATIRMSPDRTWAFGTTVIPVPQNRSTMPEVAFFVARWSLGRWQTALSGSSAFAAQLGRMPASVMPPEEARALARFSGITAQQAAAATNGSRVGDRLMLPWKIGDIWTMGTAADGGAQPGRPLGTLAFSGGDGRVLAAGDGRVYRFCRDNAGNALVMVVHDSGLASTYYRVTAVAPQRDGSLVRRGAPLGRTGTARPCGGAPSPRAEVQFGLRRGEEAVPLEGARIGGWTFREQADPLLGFAQRGLMQVLPGGLLANLGPVPPEDEEIPPGQDEGGESGKGGNGKGGGKKSETDQENPAPSATPKRSSTSEDPQ